MKKNLLSIVILALLIVNLVLTSIMMFSVTSTNKKTGAVVADIASILKLELGTEEEQESTAVSMEDTAFHDMESELTIMLAKDPLDEEAKEHFVMVQVSLSMDTTNKDYKTYGESINDNQIAGVMQEVFGKYTADEVQPRSEDIKEEILAEIQKLYNSEFIYKVTFSKLVVQ